MNDQVCVSPLGGYGGGCSGGGVVVNVGDGGDGGAGGTFSGAASSILPAVDFSTLTATQKAQIAALVTPGTGGAEGVLDGIGSAFDINTITPTQKSAITAIVAAGLDFSTLSAAQKTQIQAIVGASTGGGAATSITPAVDFSTLTAAQKDAIAKIANPPSGVDGIAPTFDLSTLTAAQKAQIQAIAGTSGTSGTLTPAQLSTLMTTLFAPGATGSILQKQADGTIQAKPVLSTLPDGTVEGDSVIWNNVTKTWEIKQPSLSIAGLKSTYALIPQSTLANPIAFVEGVDSAGNPTKSELKTLPITKGAASVTTSIVVPAVVGGTTTLLSSVTAPVAGRYMIRYKAGYGINPGALEPQGASKRVTSSLYVSSPTVGAVANNNMVSNRPAIEPVAPIAGGNRDAYGSILLYGAAGPYDLAAGEKLSLFLFGAGDIVDSGAAMPQGLVYNEYQRPELDLIKINDKELINI